MTLQRDRILFDIVSETARENLEQATEQEWLVEQLCQAFNVESAAMLLIRQDGVEHTFKPSPRARAAWNFLADFRWQEHRVADWIKSRQTFISNNHTPELTWIEQPEEFELHSLIIQPLHWEDDLYGAISLFNRRKGDFVEQDRVSLQQIGTIISKAIYQQRALQQLKIENANLEINQWQLLRSRNILRALFDSIPMSMYIIDKKYHLIAVNMDRAKRTNIPPNELVGRRCYEALYHYQDVCPDCKVIDSLFGGKRTSRTKRQWQEDDQPLEWEISTFPIVDDSNDVTQAILLEMDVTEKRRLEASLAQSEKLAAVGQLAAGLAHEINNPLTAIIANTQLLQRELQGDQDKLEMIDLIARAGQRAAQVVRNLLDLARKEEYVFEQIDLHQTIQRAISLLQHELISHSVLLTFEPAPEMPLIMASEDHLQGVWVNLIANAIDSFDDTPEREIKITTAVQNNEVRVVILDTGKGIPTERLSRIFEPFYTTKAPGKGTGLGLSLCHRIVKQHGGTIHVDSQLGMGTIFTISLPIQPRESR